jgi:hypothetical protein
MNDDRTSRVLPSRKEAEGKNKKNSIIIIIHNSSLT